ncbi:hypothetical protein EYF80_009766 [Liparis tanakae]|uniref:Uncharacterized protein n=1 Tax=Liparis tanakae TaxID=230148 RepID=A0A4Z2IPK5_9TELE|nr:hypothetical protein EYF80_009766 [Liparis tanakae]
MCLSLSRSASLMKGILSLSLRSFHRFPSLLEISALCMSGDCSMIFLLSIWDHTMNAFMGLLMWPLGVLHHAGFAGFSPTVEAGERGEAAGSSRVVAEHSLCSCGRRLSATLCARALTKGSQVACREQGGRGLRSRISDTLWNNTMFNS